MSVPLSVALFIVAGIAMESQGVADLTAYAIMGYACGAIGWMK